MRGECVMEGQLSRKALFSLALMAKNAHAEFYAKVENRYGFQMWHFEKYGKYYDFHTAEEIDYLPAEDIPEGLNEQHQEQIHAKAP